MRWGGFQNSWSPVVENAEVNVFSMKLLPNSENPFNNPFQRPLSVAFWPENVYWKPPVILKNFTKSTYDIQRYENIHSM